MKKKGLSLFVALLFTTAMLAGCGEQETTSSQQDTEKESNVSVEASTEQEDSEVKESTQEESDTGFDLFASEIAPVAEEDAVVNIGGVEVKLDQTWEEFQELMNANGWTFIDDANDFPSENKLSGAGDINTNCGTIYVRFMKNADETGSELRSVSFDPFYLTDTNVNIAGIDVNTKYEDVDGKLQLCEETDANKSYYLDDYLTVVITPITTDDTSIISVVRTLYQKR